MPPKTTTTVTLTVPTGRQTCAAWLQEQTPDTVASLLELTQTVHTLLASVSRSDSEVVAAHATQLNALKTSQRDELERVVRDLTPRIEAQRDAHHKSERTLLETQVAGAEADRDRALAELARVRTGADASLEEQRARMEGDADALRGRLGEATREAEALRTEQTLFRAKVRTEADARRAEDKVVHDESAAQMRALYESRLEAQTALVDHLRQQHKDETARLAARAQEEETRRESQYARVEQVLSSLTGSSQRRGALGEELVKQVHDALNLGLYTKNAHQRTSGFGDATWTYTPPGGGRPLTALAEVKLSHSADSANDVEKFHKDLDVAVRGQRVNAALYLSLVSRLGGRPRVDLEIVHGIPVLWASRAADDDLSAAALVEMAFTFFAVAWPVLCAREEGDDGDFALRQVVVLLNTQLDDVAKLDPRITFLERTSEAMRREATLLRKTRESLAAQITTFQSSHPALQMTHGGQANTNVDTLEEETLTAIRTFHAQNRGYYPKVSSDLRKVMNEASYTTLLLRPDVFQRCERRVRTEKGVRKKRKTEEGGGGGEEE